MCTYSLYLPNRSAQIGILLRVATYSYRSYGCNHHPAAALFRWIPSCHRMQIFYWCCTISRKVTKQRDQTEESAFKKCIFRSKVHQSALTTWDLATGLFSTVKVKVCSESTAQMEKILVRSLVMNNFLKLISRKHFMKSISFYLKYTRLKAKILCSQGLNFLIYQVYLICIYQSFTPRNTLQLQQKKIVAVLNVLIATRFPLALMFSTFYLFPFALVNDISKSKCMLYPMYIKIIL